MHGYSLRRCASSDYCGNPGGQKHSRSGDSIRRCNTTIPHHPDHTQTLPTPATVLQDPTAKPGETKCFSYPLGEFTRSTS